MGYRVLYGFPKLRRLLPTQRLVNILRHPGTSRIHHTQAILGPRMSLVGGFSQPPLALERVFFYPLAVQIHHPEIILRISVAGLGGLAPPMVSQGKIRGDTDPLGKMLPQQHLSALMAAGGGLLEQNHGGQRITLLVVATTEQFS